MLGLQALECIILAVLGVALAINCFTDIRSMEVHDLSLVCAGALTLILRSFSSEMYPVTLIGALFGFLIGYALFLGGMGFGDVKLLALIGGCLGVGGCVTALAVAGVLTALYGLIYLKFIRKRSLNTELPFVPFLTMGCAAALVFRQQWEVLF